jgi:signal transduction histidine kinase
VLPTESYANLADPDDRLRAVALLQQEASAGLNERTTLRRKQKELETALDKLRELDRLRNEFVAMVVHDIRSPVAIISGFLRVLRDNWPELDADRITEYLETTIESADQVERLVDDILTMSRIDSGEFTFDMRPTDLRRIIDKAAGQVRAATGRRVEVSSPSSLRPALVDEDRQIQILTNLLSNAVKFSPDGTPVTVSLTDRGDQLLVSVRDKGVGVDAAEQERLFRPFSRLNAHGRGKNGGTGLGLYIAKALVEGQGGSIWVDSARGDGATFSYTVLTATTRS